MGFLVVITHVNELLRRDEGVTQLGLIPDI